MPFEEYWIGKDVDFRAVWFDYERGRGYVDKYRSMEVYLLQISYGQYTRNEPLFNLEAILKTSKGLFHNLKRSYFSSDEYDRAGPLFIHSITRGSEKWRYLGELRPLLLFGIAIWSQIRKGTEQYKAERVALIDGLRQRFPNANVEEIMDYVNSLPGQEQDVALQKLFEQDPKSLEISVRPFSGKIGRRKRDLLSFDDIASHKKPDKSQ